MTIFFGYDKRQVIQALRYHFISKMEIRLMLILVNVFAIASIVLYGLKKVGPAAFITGSVLWIVLMVAFWFVLPFMVYRKAVTFRHEFSMTFTDEGFTLAHERGQKVWEWKALQHYLESPHFFHLYFDPRSFLLVPKNGCKDSNEVFALRNLLKAKVKKG